MAEKRLGIIMNGTVDEKARSPRPTRAARPATPTVNLESGVK